jgi:hypothetical protein
MKFHRSRAFICAVLLLAPLAACHMAPDVPEDAKLLYYGPVTDSHEVEGLLQQQDWDSSHQIYVFDDKEGKVVEVRTVDAKHQQLNIDWQPGRKYRIYIY